MKEFEVSSCSILISALKIQVEFEILPFSNEIEEIQFYSIQMPTEVTLVNTTLNSLVNTTTQVNTTTANSNTTQVNPTTLNDFVYKNNTVTLKISEKKLFKLRVILDTTKSTFDKSSATKTLDYKKIPHFVNEKYPIEFKIISLKQDLVICVGELIGKFTLSKDLILWKYSCKTSISPKSVIIVYGKELVFTIR